MRLQNKNAFVIVSMLLWLGCGDDADNKSTHGDAGKVSDDIDAGAIKHVDRSSLTDVGTDDAALDYSNPSLWVCRPDIDPNECNVDLDATEIAPDNSTKVVAFKRAEKPEFDCFYVYPTVLLGGGANMTDFSDVSSVLDPLLSQAARFSSLCNVYAPLYRQNGLDVTGGVGLTAGAKTQLGLADVRAAFKYYIDHLSHGRNFVIMGHSQGSIVLSQMMQMDVDNDPALRARLISALLIGGSIAVPEGQDVGGTFQHIPQCTAPGDTGCVVAYNSFAKEAPPGANAVFGKPSLISFEGDAGANEETSCTEPGALAGNSSGKYKGSYLPIHVNNPTFATNVMVPDSVKTPYVLYRDLFKGSCVLSDTGYHYLEISVDQAAGDTRMVPPYRNMSVEAIGFGLHLLDYNLPLDDLLDMVAKQAAALAKSQ